MIPGMALGSFRSLSQSLVEGTIDLALDSGISIRPGSALPKAESCPQLRLATTLLCFSD